MSPILAEEIAGQVAKRINRRQREGLEQFIL